MTPLRLLRGLPDGPPLRGVPDGAPLRGVPDGAPLRGLPDGAPLRDVALARALLTSASRGEGPPTLRLYRPRATVAFGRLDALRPGFAAAAAAARARGFQPVLRAPGGRAAAYHQSSLVIDHVAPDPDPRAGLQERFAQTGALLAEALQALGVAARVGEVPGEYCPGAYSVNYAGRIKLVGTAQRVVRTAWLMSAVVIVGDPHPLREVMEDVYGRLELPWEPATVGAVTDVVAGVTVANVERAVLASYGRRFPVIDATIDDATLAAARALEPDHRITP